MNQKSVQYIVYVGDFDLRNENVQSFLVKNNAKIFNALGFRVLYVGINTKATEFKEIEMLPPLQIENDNLYLELPTTLSFQGIGKIKSIKNSIISKLNDIKVLGTVSYIVTYQSPSYATVLNDIAKWSKKEGIPYIVNSADLPTFTLQPLYRRLVMKANWDYMHYINKKYSCGIIAVTKYIENFYKSNGVNSIVVPPLFARSTTDYWQPKINDKTTFVYAGVPFKFIGKKVNPKGMKDRLDRIIDIFSTLSNNIDYKFIIVGIEKDEYLMGVPRQTSFLNNCEKIQFLGKKNHSDTMDYVLNADFTINYRDKCLMTEAGFSTKIVESVSLGTPVIINDISDNFKYLCQNRTGFKLSGNINEDSDLICMLCQLTAEKRQELKMETHKENPFEYRKYIPVFDKFLKSIFLQS